MAIEMKVIDVSKHNGVIDWQKVKASGIQGVIIRAGYGRMLKQKDLNFEEYYAGATAAGLHVGAYHYSYARSAAEALVEASVFLEWVKGKKFDLPVYFDTEDKSIMNLNKNTLTDCCIAWCNKLEENGYYAGIYASASWFIEHLELSKLTRYDKWLAHWASKPRWGNEFGGLWQYSEKGKVPGIQGDVDLDLCYRDYPSIIRSKGLNGYSTTPMYKVTAHISNIKTKAAADEVADICQKQGMTTIIEEE